MNSVIGTEYPDPTWHLAITPLACAVICLEKRRLQGHFVTFQYSKGADKTKTDFLVGSVAIGQVVMDLN